MKFMKKISHILLTCIAVVVFATMTGSCRKAPINGKLDGLWQIMKIEYLADGTDVTSQRRSYISINLHVVQLTDVTETEDSGASISGNLNYDESAGILTMNFPYNTSESSLPQLQSWGIYTNPVTFSIVKLDGRQLILKSTDTLITCRRF